jgi:hypothetical protein
MVVSSPKEIQLDAAAKLRREATPNACNDT